MIHLDDAALEALSNKGVLRRAKADLGQARLLGRDEGGALVEVDGLQLRLGPKGLRAQDCPCPATGICRHLVTAALVLREAGEAPVSPGMSARDEVMALTRDEIVRFAAGDLASALTLATGPLELTEDQSTLTLVLGDLAPVQVLAGQGLRGAVFKGPATRKRLAVAAAVLALRKGAGLLPEAPAPAPPGLPPELLQDLARGLEQLFTGALRGGAALACDRIFDLAVSARALAAPRLAGELRALVAQAEDRRGLGFDPEAFARQLARTYALVHALQHDQPSSLTGVLRRSHLAAPPLSLAMLAAEPWVSGSGARGLTLQGLDVARGTWIAAVEARAGGSDPGFSPRAAYDQPLIAGLHPRAMMGRWLDLPAPRLSADGQLALSCEAGLGGTIAPARLRDSPALIRDWSALVEDCARRLPPGLQGLGRSVPVALCPARLRAVAYDEIGQTCRLVLTDGRGQSLLARLETRDSAAQDWLVRAPLLALVARAERRAGLELTLISAILAAGDGVSVVNLGLDPRPKAPQGLWRRLTTWPEAAPLDIARPSADATLRALVDLGGGGANRVPQVAEAAEARGQAQLARALRRASASGAAGDLLRAIYIADLLESLPPPRSI